MQSFSTVLPALQQPTQTLEPPRSMSLTLQRGSMQAGGMMTSPELSHAQTAHSQPLTPEAVSSTLSSLRVLNSCRKITETFQTSDDPAYPNGRFLHRLTYCLPEGHTTAMWRALLVETIRPADKRLTTILLTQLAIEKPFFDADQDQVKYRLQHLAADLADYPYVAIWKAIDDIRTQSIKRGFPETAEILQGAKFWTNYIVDAFEFFKATGE